MTKTPDRPDKGMDRQRGQNPNDPQQRNRKPGEQDDDYTGERGGGERGGERGGQSGGGGGSDRGRKGGSDR